MFKKILHLGLIFTLLINIVFPCYSEINDIVAREVIFKTNLPCLQYLSVNSANPYNFFNFLLNKGDIIASPLSKETQKLVNYFFLGLLLPNNDFWVNLQPDTPERLTSTGLTKTDMGKVLLEQDLQLKKDVAKYLSPKNSLGRKLWEEFYKIVGTSQVKHKKIDFNNRVWIIPDIAMIAETEQGALIKEAKFKVLSESEYLNKNTDDQEHKIYENIFKQIIIPQITNDVNFSKQYAPLRQIYNSLILAEWYKRKHLSDDNRYSKAIDSGDIDWLITKTPWSKQNIWQDYIASYKQGEYQIKETILKMKRLYVSGGIMPAALESVLKIEEFKGDVPDTSNLAIIPVNTTASSPAVGDSATPNLLSNIGLLDSSELDIVNNAFSTIAENMSVAPATIAKNTLNSLLKNIKELRFNDDVFVFVSACCNFKCPQCFYADRRGRFMDLGTFKKICDQLKGYSRITILGGEPLLNIQEGAEIYQMINYAAAQFKTVRVVTNGYSIYELLGKQNGNIEEFTDKLPKNIEIDLSDDPDHRNEYKRNTGDSANFDKVKEALAKKLSPDKVKIVRTVAFSEIMKEPVLGSNEYVSALFAQGAANVAMGERQVNPDSHLTFRENKDVHTIGYSEKDIPTGEEYKPKPVSINKLANGISSDDIFSALATNYGEKESRLFYPANERSLFILTNGDVVDSIEATGLKKIPDSIKLGNINQDSLATIFLARVGNDLFNYKLYPRLFYYIVSSIFDKLDNNKSGYFLEKANKTLLNQDVPQFINNSLRLDNIGGLSQEIAGIVLWNRYSELGLMKRLDKIDDLLFNSGNNTIWELDLPDNEIVIILERYFKAFESGFLNFCNMILFRMGIETYKTPLLPSIRFTQDGFNINFNKGSFDSSYPDATFPFLRSILTIENYKKVLDFLQKKFPSDSLLYRLFSYYSQDEHIYVPDYRPTMGTRVFIDGILRDMGEYVNILDHLTTNGALAAVLTEKGKFKKPNVGGIDLKINGLQIEKHTEDNNFFNNYTSVEKKISLARKYYLKDFKKLSLLFFHELRQMVIDKQGDFSNIRNKQLVINTLERLKEINFLDEESLEILNFFNTGKLTK